jgi:hypothetical protein
MPGVAVAPVMTLTRILRSRNSLAHVCANDRIAALMAACTPIPSLPRSATFDELRITDAPSASNGSALLHGEDQALEVDVQHVGEVLLGDVAEAGDVEDGGVGEEHVDPTSALGDRRVQPVEILGLGDVTLDGDAAAAEFRYGAVEFGLPAPGDEDRGTSVTKRRAVARPMPAVPPVMTAVSPGRSAAGVPP